jgi:hypothetical protein
MATYERIDYGSADGSQWGGAASDKVALYGAVPVIQRAYSSAVHASSALASSASFGATQLAVVNEIQATLVALGIWASS